MKNYFTHARLAAFYLFTAVFSWSFLLIKVIQQKAAVVIYANPATCGAGCAQPSTGQGDAQLELVLMVLQMTVAAYFAAAALFHTIKAIGEAVRPAANSPAE